MVLTGLRKGVAASVIATALADLVAVLAGTPAAIFLSPMSSVLGEGAILLGLLFRGVILGAIFAVVEPFLPGRSIVLKAVLVAVVTWTMAILVANAIILGGISPAGPAGQLATVVMYGVLLGAVYRLTLPEEWSNGEHGRG